MRPAMAKGTTRLLRALLVGVTLVAGALSPRVAPAAQGGRRAITVLVPEAGNLQILAFWVALGGDYFAREGLDVNLIVAESPAQAQGAFKSGAAPVAILPGPDYERLIADRFPFLLAANLLQNDPVELLMRREVADRLHLPAGKGVRQRLDALRGVSIGVTTHDLSRLYELFHSQHLDANLAQVVVRKGEELPGAFKSSEIDAVFTPTPYLEKFIADDDAVVLVDLAAGEVPDFAERLIQAMVVARPFAAAQPGEVSALVRAVAKAEHALHFDPASATEALVRVLPRADRRRLTRTVAVYGHAVPATPHVEAQLVKREARYYPAGGAPLRLEGIDLESYILPGQDFGVPASYGGSGGAKGPSRHVFIAILGALALGIAFLLLILDQRSEGEQAPRGDVDAGKDHTRDGAV
jgi:ABC-type nitrate/sulfonate/bicarbonate transport system substrate-binding protein